MALIPHITSPWDYYLNSRTSQWAREISRTCLYISSIYCKYLTSLKFEGDSSEPTSSELNSCGICEVDLCVKSIKWGCYCMLDEWEGTLVCTWEISLASARASGSARKFISHELVVHKNLLDSLKSSCEGKIVGFRLKSLKNKTQCLRGTQCMIDFVRGPDSVTSLKPSLKGYVSQLHWKMRVVHDGLHL